MGFRAKRDLVVKKWRVWRGGNLFCGEEMKSCFEVFGPKDPKYGFLKFCKKMFGTEFFLYFAWSYSGVITWNCINWLYWRKKCFKVLGPRKARNWHTMRFFKVYEKSTCGIFLIFGYFLKLATTTFFGKSCAGNANEDYLVFRVKLRIEKVVVVRFCDGQ